MGNQKTPSLKTFRIKHERNTKSSKHRTHLASAGSKTAQRAQPSPHEANICQYDRKHPLVGETVLGISDGVIHSSISLETRGFLRKRLLLSEWLRVRCILRERLWRHPKVLCIGLSEEILTLSFTPQAQGEEHEEHEQILTKSATPRPGDRPHL